VGEPTLTRTTFEMSRALEFFTERELQMQIGFPRWHWPIALTKELLDNALDACETAGVTPEITVTLDGHTLIVHDNGPGVPETTLQRSLDYLVRVSDKAHYVSPSRGQLGNALKCVWAAPYVMSRDGVGRVEVETGSRRYQVDVQLDHLAQQPQVSLTTQETGKRKTGTSLTIHFPEEAIDVQVCFWKSRRPVGVPSRFLRSSAQTGLTPCRDV
jgi:DNA topoisomerase VI subunit B